MDNLTLLATTALGVHQTSSYNHQTAHTVSLRAGLSKRLAERRARRVVVRFAGTQFYAGVVKYRLRGGRVLVAFDDGEISEHAERYVFDEPEISGALGANLLWRKGTYLYCYAMCADARGGYRLLKKTKCRRVFSSLCLNRW